MPKSKPTKKTPSPPSLTDETKTATTEIKRRRIKEALILTENNRQAAAKMLKCPHRTFYHWLHDLGLLTWKLTDEPELVAQVMASRGVSK